MIEDEFSSSKKSPTLRHFRIFFLGLGYFYSILFLTKFFDWSLKDQYSLLLMSAFPIGAHLVYNVAKRSGIAFGSFDAFLVLGLYGLSVSKTSSSPWPTVMSAFLVVAFFQKEIVNLFESETRYFKSLYSLEVLGGLAGMLIWLLLSAAIGFKGYVFIIASISGFVFLLKDDRWVKKLLQIALLFFALYKLGDPEPIFNKRDRNELLKNADKIAVFWDPNGHIEFIRKESSLIALIEGGSFRSHVPFFSGKFDEVLRSFMRSEPTSVWGLDVVVPHYLQRNLSEKRVALISALGGQEILAAKTFGANEIFAIEINSSGQTFVANQLKAWSGDLYKGVHQIHSDGRHFIAKDHGLFDVIQIYSAANTAYSATLGNELTPSSLITREAFITYIKKLKPSGILHIAQNNYHKMKVTFDAALASLGQDSNSHIISLKRLGPTFDLTSFIYKKSGWHENEIVDLKHWFSSDKSQKWQFLCDPTKKPHCAVPSPKAAPSPSTDDMPFAKLVKPVHSYPSFLILIFFTAAAFLCWALVALLSKKNISFVDLNLSFLLGICFSFVQPLLVLQVQTVLANPSTGLVAGNALLLAAIVLGTRITDSLQKPQMIRLGWAIVAMAALVLSYTSGFFHKIAFILLFPISIFHSVAFVSRFVSSEVQLYLSFNSLGVAFGLGLFHICFLSIGLSHTLALAAILSILTLAVYQK